MEIAGAGWGTQMRGIVVCISQDYVFVEGEGSATFKMRDSSGDVLVYQTTQIVTWQTPRGRHFAEFKGEYEVATAECTGRYAGATGKGYIEGWADNDPTSDAPVLDPSMPPPSVLTGSGQGYAEMAGTLILRKPACGK